MREHARQSLVEFGSLITAIGEELFQERKHPKQGCHDENAAIAILNVGRMDDGMKQQAQRVYENMPLLTLDLLARIIAVRIDAGPPFSTLFTPSSYFLLFEEGAKRIRVIIFVGQKLLDARDQADAFLAP